MNNCSSCKTELYLNATPNASGECECQTDYRWDTNTGKCVRDAICGEWSGWTANASTAQETRTRTITQQPNNGGNNCSDGNLDTVQTRSFSQDCVETEVKVNNTDYGYCEINSYDDIHSHTNQWRETFKRWLPRYNKYKVTVTTPKIGTGTKCTNFTESESKIKNSEKIIYKKNNNKYDYSSTYFSETHKYHQCYKNIKSGNKLNGSFSELHSHSSHEKIYRYDSEESAKEACFKYCTGKSMLEKNDDTAGSFGSNTACPGFKIYKITPTQEECTGYGFGGQSCSIPPAYWKCQLGGEGIITGSSSNTKYYINPLHPDYFSKKNKLGSAEMTYFKNTPSYDQDDGTTIWTQDADDAIELKD
jgi:hypothetical protein